MKSQLFPKLRRMALPEEAKARIRQRVLLAVELRQPRWGLGWRQYCSLVAPMADAAFMAAVEACARDEDPKVFVARRARWLLGYLARVER